MRWGGDRPLWDGNAQDWRVSPRITTQSISTTTTGRLRWWMISPGTQGGLQSVCAARLLPERGGDAEYIPLFLRPSAPAADAVFLVSTCTYMAYANYRVMNRSNLYEMYLGQVPEVVESDLYLNLHPELGDSLYTTHSDGSGMAISSRLRPILNMRPNSTLSAFSDDGWIWSFLRHEGLACDMLTDEDLDREGVVALAGYRLVVTGNHPEYVTTRMWDACWPIGRQAAVCFISAATVFTGAWPFTPRCPVMELRRTETARVLGVGTGEYYHAFTGAAGGICRCTGPANPSGMASLRFDISRPTAGCQPADPRVAFLFEGVRG